MDNSHEIPKIMGDSYYLREVPSRDIWTGYLPEGEKYFLKAEHDPYTNSIIFSEYDYEGTGLLDWQIVSVGTSLLKQTKRRLEDEDNILNYPLSDSDFSSRYGFFLQKFSKLPERKRYVDEDDLRYLHGISVEWGYYQLVIFNDMESSVFIYDGTTVRNPAFLTANNLLSLLYKIEDQ